MTEGVFGRVITEGSGVCRGEHAYYEADPACYAIFPTVEISEAAIRGERIPLEKGPDFHVERRFGCRECGRVIQRLTAPPEVEERLDGGIRRAIREALGDLGRP